MIEANALEKRYGAIRAVDGISFSVKPGEIVGLLGPNGAGKSTTMKMVTGFLRPDGGTARICGHDIGQAPLAAKRSFGYLPETGPLYPEMTVREFLRFSAELRGLHGPALRAAVERVYGLCHLQTVAHQSLETLSKGYRQRVGLAHAVLHDPACLILDEPTDGLDPNQKNEIRRVIKAMAADKAIMLSTHILEEVEAMCTRVLIVNHGRIVADATPQALKAQHPDRHAVRLQAAAEVVEALAGWAAGEDVRMEKADDGWHILRPAGDVELMPRLLAAIARHSWQVAQLEPLPLPLDAVFAALTANALN